MSIDSIKYSNIKFNAQKKCLNALTKDQSHKQNTNLSFGRSTDSFERQRSSEQRRYAKYKATADKYYHLSLYGKAIKAYKECLKINPDALDVQLKLAKSYKKTKNLPTAIKVYKNILRRNPNNLEVLTLAGECYKDLDDYPEAIRLYKQATRIDPKYDLAQRAVKELDNLILAKFDENIAKDKKEEYKEFCLKEAMKIFNENAPDDLVQALDGIDVKFDVTGKLSGHSNIAQYENENAKIVVKEDYCWADPRIVADYLVHEAVHAKDRDPYTSIKEEQDAYRKQVKFWSKINDGVKDPELDYALGLFNEGPEALDKKIEEVYRSRDPNISSESPGHRSPPHNKFRRFLSGIPLIGELF